MPANLPPEYFAVERLYREAKTIEEKVKYLEELISTIPKHKGTDKLRADYRAKLAKLKSSAQASKKTSKHLSQFHIEREGVAGRAVILGCSNTGKSSLLSFLTHAKPEISDLPFTTWVPTPGIVLYENMHIQLIDTPPLDKEFIEPEFIELIKTSDAIILMLDMLANPIEQFQFSIQVLNEHRIYSDHQEILESDKRVFIFPFLIAANKDDNAKLDDDFEVLNELLHDNWDLIPISITAQRNLEKLLELLIKKMRIIRVYTKPPGKEADLTQPFILKEGSTISDFTLKVHKDFHEKLKTARVWGKGVFPGQHVSRDHVLNDGDIVELHI
ncbi:MAG: TGS domain-containing protein [Ignavibacteria bacterium]|nr:TGS domain-containing protein [Ignavibacteria bacterium]